jgi:hypothetical protein
MHISFYTNKIIERRFDSFEASFYFVVKIMLSKSTVHSYQPFYRNEINKSDFLYNENDAIQISNIY